MPSLEQICRDLGLDPSRFEVAVHAFMMASRDPTQPTLGLFLRPAFCAFLAEMRPARAPRKPKPVYGLTVDQAKTLEFIRDYTLQRNGIAPSYDEIAAHLGIRSKSNIHRIMIELRARGAVTWIPNHARSIVVLRDSARNPRFTGLEPAP